ncbi:Tat pathway signal sequence domain protein [Ruania halotolerans]|uniref:exo-rhamnogalacturonan lyase family protein n=1 Tax=Ruania halotolerans TaxID=2897773 RepID=UPI001E49D72C|nr:Tat pathway signal sequence domain protein [Ruania halotolerans]UFU08269.1 Tat pathway signal sequence domain protein [Ruania halotolerans]
MVQISRRTMLASSAVASAGVALGAAVPAIAAPRGPAAPREPTEPAGPVDLRWLEQDIPEVLAAGVTWGVPWARGSVPGDQAFALHTDDGTVVPVQSWGTAWWPDGSLKWSAHAVSDASPLTDGYRLERGEPATPETALRVSENGGRVRVDTGVIVVDFAKAGDKVIRQITRDGRTIASDGRLVASRQNVPDTDRAEQISHESFRGMVDAVTVEQDGPIRAVIKVEGTHGRGANGWLPFVLRFALFAGSDGIRLVHTFFYDGDENQHFINGLGVEFSVPMHADLHDRHVRFTSAEGGVLAEAVRPITGLRRDPGAEAKAAQVAGEATPDTSTWDQRVTSRLHLIPAFGSYSISQLTAHGYQISKRTSVGHSWLTVDSGSRAGGLGYVGSPGGGLAFGLRNFWQLHPTELEVDGADTDTARATVWMWSPRASAMDVRFYHDGLGQDTYEEQLEGLNITYEDYEPGFGTPYGVARTSELTFWALAATPPAERLVELSRANAAPPLLVTSPEQVHGAGVFGSWTPVDRSTPARAEIEDRLDAIHTFHRQQVDQRSWYGFWDYGDVMHSYDADRHVWRYDIGGYAWDNSELSTDSWLWYHYLRTGDANAFRFAEAMTRHTGEVDVYHLGQWKGLGTRHNVMHWGDSAKQVRISNANYRRFYYFLTADERTGDLLHELVDSDRTYLVLNAGRKVDGSTGPYDPDPAALPLSKTTDWGAIAGAWLTEWERDGDPVARERLLASARSIAALPNGWAQQGGLYNLETAEFHGGEPGKVQVGSLSAVFGLIELMTEFLELVDEPEVKEKWVEFCRLYNASRKEQAEATGEHWGNLNLRQSYARATAYAAVALDDPELAERAWEEFRRGHAGYPQDHDFGSVIVEPPRVLKTVDEADLSTNANALYGLTAIQCMALIGDSLD